MAPNRSLAVPLRKLLDACPAPIFVLDSERRVVFVNPAFRNWAGETGDLVGAVCNQHAPAMTSSQTGEAAGLCPPVEALRGHAVAGCVEMGGRREQASFQPLSGPSPEGGDCPVLCVIGAGLPEDAENQIRSANRSRPDTAQAWRDVEAALALDCLAGDHPALVLAREQVRLAASAPRCGVVITGPEGSGRELTARGIHVQRGGGSRLTPLSCGLLDEELLRMTLRAASDEDPIAGEASATTLLLLDVDLLPKEAQVVLQSRLSGRASWSLLSTAQNDLSALVRERRFLPELAALLSTLTIRLPALEDRLEDLPLLANMAIDRHNATGARQIGGVTPGALDLLAAFPWTRGVHELWEVLESSLAKANGPKLTVEDLSSSVRFAATMLETPDERAEPIDLDAELVRFETQLIQDALVQAGQNKAGAARLLGIPRSRLLRRMEQFGLDADGEPSPREES